MSGVRCEIIINGQRIMADLVSVTKLISCCSEEQCHKILSEFKVVLANLQDTLRQIMLAHPKGVPSCQPQT